MILSERGKRFIKNEEGLRLQAYICASGKLTIGYGHRLGPGFTLHTKIDQATADKYFDEDIARFCKQLDLDVVACANGKPTQDEYDALVSFIFNIGINAWINSTARRHFIKGLYASVPTELQRWVHDDHGNVIAGLKARRNRERDLFLGILSSRS